MSETKPLTFNDLEVNERFTTTEPFASGILTKRCGNKAENAEGLLLDFAGIEEVVRCDTQASKEKFMGDAKLKHIPLAGVSDETLAAIDAVMESKDLRKCIVNYDDLPKEQKQFMARLGVKADKVYYASTPNDLPEEANQIRIRLQNALLSNVCNMLGEFLDYMPAKFEQAGYPITYVAYGFPRIEYMGVEIKIDGVSFLALQEVS